MTNLTGSEINRLGSEAEMLPFVSMTNVVEVRPFVSMTNVVEVLKRVQHDKDGYIQDEK